MRRILFLIVIGFVALGAMYALRDTMLPQFFEPTPSGVENGDTLGEAAPAEVVAERLEIPWEIVFLPDGTLLVTERPGRLLYIGEDRQVIEVSGVAHRGEGGLLGLALHPRFSSNRQIYLYLTTAQEGGLTNRVERYTFSNGSLSDRRVIIEGIPGAANHDGGRIAFGPDGMLYVGTGDAGSAERAQDTNSLAGNILRLAEDGSTPVDNPFGNAVYSYGHRNVQGLAWDSRGQLWATEHGRSGVQSGFDEVNKIVKGANYGWPQIQGDQMQEGMVAPELHSGATETWAPSGMTILNGHIIFAGLRGEALYTADISSGEAQALRAYLRGKYGRLRTVVIGPDDMLYILTNNRDGRGRPSAPDDRIIKIDPRTLGLDAPG